MKILTHGYLEHGEKRWLKVGVREKERETERDNNNNNNIDNSRDKKRFEKLVRKEKKERKWIRSIWGKAMSDEEEE